MLLNRRNAGHGLIIHRPHIDRGTHLEVVLNINHVALIDFEDAELVAGYTWCVFNGDRGYKSVVSRSKDKKFIQLHRLVLGARKGDKVTHVNGNKLDNRRANLSIIRNDEPEAVAAVWAPTYATE